ncbi:MAG: hypothetical protein SFX18_15715 [Pirellulales bacterium]|nr:hypothetical protein [Pirellulales bacterium]
MTTIDITALAADPLSFLARVDAGETLRIARGTQVIAEIQPPGSQTTQIQPPQPVLSNAALDPLTLPNEETFLAELRRPRTPEELAGPPRPFGLCKGLFEVPDDFDDPLPEDILREFEGT